ncbi:hypothetical protein BCR35DRAFT_356046 [Leucosporidium creatinivorum]|uniref:Uncharacterized protein n=1 Tax=Leucosporidium creatinivorum TaxID=106004 RepID=A0A1Y2D0P4_9BASI|nr:hypothetical protein BCR35DRAFT_356046 [Leucosporidium creatinivorum]
MDPDDWLNAGFEVDDDEPVSNARAERIAAAREAAASYQAKIEEPRWFMAENVQATKPGATRPEFFVLHQLYIDGAFEEVQTRAMALFARERKGGAEDVELMDIALRACLKSGQKVTPEVLELARGYATRPTHPSLAFSASRIFAASPPSLVTPLEPLEAILAALSRHSTLLPYLTWLSKLLVESQPLLHEVLVERTLQGREAEVEKALDGLGLSEQGRRTMEKVLGVGGEVREEEEETVRDVRSL